MLSLPSEGLVSFIPATHKERTFSQIEPRKEAPGLSLFLFASKEISRLVDGLLLLEYDRPPLLKVGGLLQVALGDAEPLKVQPLDEFLFVHPILLLARDH